MRKLLLMILFFVGLIHTLDAQNIGYSTPYGFRYATNIVNTNAFSWTNDNFYPFRLLNMAIANANASTTTVAVIRRRDVVHQVRGDVITTNDMGGIETNYYYTVTNIVISYVTNAALLTLTNTAGGTALSDESDFKKIYILFGDILRWTFGDTNNNAIMFDAVR